MTKRKGRSYTVELFHDVDPEMAEDGYDNSAGEQTYPAHGIEFDISGNGHEYTLWFQTKEEADKMVKKVIEIRKARREAKKLAIEKDAAFDRARDLQYAAENPNPKIKWVD